MDSPSTQTAPVDSAQQILAPVSVDDGIKAQAWEAFHSASSAQDFAQAVGNLNLPQEIKASLWEAKNAIPAARAAIAANPPAMPKPPNAIMNDTSYQAVPSEQTPEGNAAAIAQREKAQPVIAAAGHAAIGAGKGAGTTVNTVEGVGNRLLGATGMIDDQTFQNNMKNLQAQKEKLTPEGFAENVGFNLEGLAEWMVTAEAGGAALNATKKFSSLADAANWLLANPVKARLLGNAAMAATQTAANTASQGGTVGDIAKSGAIGAGIGAGAGLAAEGVSAGISKTAESVSNLLERMGIGGDALKAAQSMARLPVRTAQEQSEDLTKALDTEEASMHGDFDRALNEVRGSLSGKVLKASDTPLYSAAQALKNQDASLSPELVEGLRNLTPNAGRVDKTLDSILAEPEAGMTGDYLIDLRRRLNKSITSADPLLKPAIAELRNSVDSTLDQMDAGASSRYASARTAYKAKLDALEDPAVVALRAGKYNDATDYLTSGPTSVAKINALKAALSGSSPMAGSRATFLLGVEKFTQIAQEATDDAGNLNLSKFVVGWRKIPQAAREAMFSDTNAGKSFLDNLNAITDSAQRHARTVKSIKLGSSVLPLLGTAIGYEASPQNKGTGAAVGAVVGLASAFGGHAAAKSMVDLIANNPALLEAAGKSAVIPRALQVATSAVQPLASHGAANAASSVVTHTYDPATGTLKPTQR